MSPDKKKLITQITVQVVMIAVALFVGRWSKSYDDKNTQLDDKLKKDIAEMIIKQLKPVIDDKLPRKEFDIYKESHDKEYEADKKLLDQRYESALLQFQGIATQMIKMNEDYQKNNRQLNKAINDLYRLKTLK